MSTRKPALPKYRCHKGSGQAFIQVKGIRHYLGKWNTPESRERYRRAIAEMVQASATEIAAPVPHQPGDGPTVVELAASYLDFAVGYYVKDGLPTGSLDRVKAALRVLRSLYATLPVDEFGPLKLEAIQTHLVQQRKSRRYANHLTQAIRRVFRWGVAKEMVPPSVATALAAVTGLKKGRTEAREPGKVLPVADATVQRTLPHLPEIVADIVRLQRLTGARPAEICILRPIDVDRSGDVWVYRPAAYNGSSPRVFP